ncbi:MAG: DegT/DnrJ/EryC1/StrS family aminotransferase [Verrucomicrobiales bacterium]
MRQKINYAGPSITTKEEEYVLDAVRNGFYANYRRHAGLLEEKVATLLGVRHALATNSCTAAIHLALLALGIGPDDEVITTDSTCVASALPITYTGATAVFVDVDPATWCLDPAAVRAAITPKTKAILVVHWNGHPAEMDSLMAIAREHDLRVIEDGAPSLGAEYRGRKVGTIGDLGTFSFQGAKVAIGGMGGVLVTDDESLLKKAQVFASYGRTDSAMMYWSDYVGFNYTMPNLPAALALAQVERLDELIDQKRRIFSWYEEGLDGAPRLRLIKEADGTRSTCCYPPLEMGEDALLDRAALITELKADNIDIRPAQPRCSGMPMFERRFDNPHAQAVESRGLILPSAFNLRREDVDFVCQRLRSLA